VEAAVITTGNLRHASLKSDHQHQHDDTQFFAGWVPFLSPN